MMALKNYIDLWGKEWVDLHHDTIGIEESVPVDDSEPITFSFVEDESNRPSSPPKDFDSAVQRLQECFSRPEDFSTPPSHKTTFIFDPKAGTVEVIAHY